ncbi:hypothetical protein JCM6882_005555 [Rhodosporidiobolus microsporus]
MAAVVSPLPHHLHDSSLTTALGMRTASGSSREPSPWSKFLSPSLFANEPGQRSSPLPAVAAPTPSPLKQVHNHPSLFTHAKEINPFEQSFSYLPPGGGDVVGASGAGLNAVEGAGTPARTKRKRAMSSPAIFTPGGTGEPIAETTKEAFLHQTKRPSLRLAVQNGLPAHMVTAASLAPSESTMSFRSSTTNSFDETTAGSSSFLRHRRGQSLTHTISPDSSIAPSPHSPKHLSPYPPPAGTFAHFQPAPIPFSMPPPVPGSMPYADPHGFAATLAPSALGVDAIAPLPYVSQAPVATFEPLPHIPPTDGSFAYPPQPIPLDPYAIPSFAPAATTLPMSAVADPAGLVMAVSPVVPQGMPLSYPPIPAATLAPSSLPLGPVVAPLPIIPPPPAASTSTSRPPAKKPSAPKPKPALAASTSSSTSATAPPAQTVGPDGQPLPKPKPPGKKRGRKPKNWDPTLEKTVELEPEEQERQKKLALERNRIAASKSRRRKKERVELLETAATELCTRNLALQADCRALLAEVHSLRAFMTQSHPPGCPCVHINGYLARETDGGGIPAILYGAGATLDRDYARVPKCGQDEDVYEGAVETAALEALAAGGSLGDVPGLGGVAGSLPTKAGGKKKQAKDAAEAAARAVAEQMRGGGAAAGAIPMRVRQGSEEHEESEDEEGGEDDEQASSEEERVELKSRRARTITAKSQRD